ncbi:MAG: Nif3-like dinuclear metal center hexameric protein, partial [bacterium]|nr:Nif3-like dinuclear metal center hexameric protein [bacterium]
MIQRSKLLNYLADFLKVAEFDDYCINGLQLEGTDTIKTVVLGVSVSRRLFQQAIARRADMIIVHHGLFWKNDPSPLALTGIMRERVALLITNNINLAGYHLPLDAHPEIGNNAQIMKRLNIVPIQPVD